MNEWMNAHETIYVRTVQLGRQLHFLCRLLLLGYYSTINGSTSCQICKAGFYTGQTPGSQTCTPCAAGSYSQTNASATCLTCGQGTISLVLVSRLALLVRLMAWHALMAALLYKPVFTRFSKMVKCKPSRVLMINVYNQLPLIYFHLVILATSTWQCSDPSIHSSMLCMY